MEFVRCMQDNRHGSINYSDVSDLAILATISCTHIAELL